MNSNKFNRSKNEEADKINSYGEIKLIFGKHKGKTLQHLVDEENDYCKWLLESMKEDKSERKNTPTQMAIMKFFEHKI